MVKALDYYNIDGASETSRFVDMFDRFFDCLNVKDLNEYKKKKKPNLRLYYNTNDECLLVYGSGLQCGCVVH